MMDAISFFLRTTYWAQDYLKGSPVRAHYRDIKETMENYTLGEKKRKEYLVCLLTHATKYAPFYKGYSPSNLMDFPIVNKAVLMKNYDKVRIPLDAIPYQKGEVFLQTTSGSTGMPFAVPQNTSKRNRRIAELKYFGERSGFKSHKKLIHLRTWNRWQNKSKWQSIREGIIPFNITKINDKRWASLCEIINRQRVFAIRGYASSLDLLTHYAADNRITFPHLKIMIAVSESLQDSTRTLVRNYLSCKIISQYGNEENGVLGQEFIRDSGISPFFLNHASYFFEILKFDEDIPAEEGELGRIVLTDLFNYAFPMIRYDTGDTGIKCKGSVESEGYPMLSALYGRRIDMVFDTHGEIVHPMAIARILKHYSRINQWQFIQNDKDGYILKVSADPDGFNAENVKEELLNLFGQDANIMLEYADEIPVLSSGKRKSVLNNYISTTR